MVQDSRKRPHSADTELPPKKLRKHSESVDVHETPRDDDLESFQDKKYVPHQSIGLMHRVTLSMLCLLRTYRHKDEYSSLTIAFGDDQIDRFRDIVIHYNNKSVHVQVEDVDTYNKDNFISYAELFGERRRSSLNNRFNSFVKYAISRSEDSANVEYLIIYSSSGLNLTEDGRLRRNQCKNFYPFKFRRINLEKYGVLKNFLCKDGEEKKDAEENFYKFSRDKPTREELLGRLKLSLSMQKLITEKDLPPEFEIEIKKEFLNKLIIASKMPRREELRVIIRKEIERKRLPDDYTSLKQRVLSALGTSKKPRNSENSIPGIIYEFNILTSLLHTMFCHKTLFSIEIEGRSQNSSNDILINYRNRSTYIRPVLAEIINYKHLFPSEKDPKKELSLNEYFTLFLQKLKKNVRFLIIFTNGHLDLGENDEFRKRQSVYSFPLKFEKIDIKKKKYKILRNCRFFNENGLYQFSEEEATRNKILSLLKFPDSLGSEFFDKEMKEKFLERLIFAVDQADETELKDVVEKVVNEDDRVYKLPYDYEELNETTIRSLESRRFGLITRETMEEILEDVKMDRSSHQELRERDIEIMKFVKVLIGCRADSSPCFNRFLKYITEGPGKKYIEFIENNGISLASVSSILFGSKSQTVRAFKDLCDLWFDTRGNKTQFLKILEEVNFSNLSNMLHMSGSSAADAFRDLHYLWFDTGGNKTRYLKNLEKNRIGLRYFSTIVHGAGHRTAETFKALHDILFDSKGNKTRYLETLEREGMNFANMSGLLSGTGIDSVETFKRIYALWFDVDGEKSKYLKNLEREKIHLKKISSVLYGAGVHSPEAYTDLCDLWFDNEGNKTHYLRTIKELGILPKVLSLLRHTGIHAARVFKNLYTIWFDDEGNKRQVLVSLDKEGIKLSHIFTILRGARFNVVKEFESLCQLLFDKEGRRMKYLITLEKENIHFSVLANILSTASTDGSRAFTDLFNLWFDEEGNKKLYLNVLEKSRIPLIHVAGILNGAGANAAEAFKNLYNSWFDSKGQMRATLLHFLEEKNGKCFTTAQLFTILYASGTKGGRNFEKLHDVLFNEDGSPTELLMDFYDGGFEPQDFTIMLQKKQPYVIASTIKQLHSFYFCKEKERDKGDFWCGKKRERLVKDFLKEDFSRQSLQEILQKGYNTPGALKKLHDVCFDKTGKRTQILEDFYALGFKPHYLDKILWRTGNNASEILRIFHASCFGEERHLERFVAEGELFTPKNLCKILGKRGSGVCSVFEKLGELCYKKGEKTKYLRKLMRNKSSDEIIEILRGEVGD